MRSDQSIGSIPDVLSSNSVLDGTWHHVTWVDKAGAVTLYVDGKIDPASFSYIRTNATPLLRSNITWTLNSEALGALWRTKAGGSRLDCQMDDVAWWGRALSYSEVQYLQTNPVPPPSVLTAPSITILPWPTSFTNAFVGDSDTISAAVTGTQPISLQWYVSATTNYTGTAISGVGNPSAQTTALTLTNLQAANSGYYYLIASNGAALGSGQSGGGLATSAVVQVVVNTYATPITNANTTVLMLEFNAAATPGNVQPGYQSMTLTTPSARYNSSTKVTLSPIDGAVLADRDRNTTAYPNSVSNNPPAFTTALIYNSFIFDDVRTGGSGIDMLVPASGFQHALRGQHLLLRPGDRRRRHDCLCGLERSHFGCDYRAALFVRRRGGHVAHPRRPIHDARIADLRSHRPIGSARGVGSHQRWA